MLELIATYALAGSGINWVYKNIGDGKFKDWYSEYAASQDDPWARIPMQLIHKLFDCSFCTSFHIGWIVSWMASVSLGFSLLIGLATGFLSFLLAWVQNLATLYVAQANGTIKADKQI